MVQMQRNTRFNPIQLLDSAYTTIGEHAAGEMGLAKSGYQRFNFQHVKTLEASPGNVVLKDVCAYTNSSTASDEVTRYYGGLTGSAGINLNGQPTLRNTIPAVVIPDRKRNALQRAAVRDSFASLCKGGKNIEEMEVNPAAVHLYQSMDGGETKSILVIEASGTFGVDKKGKPFYWSILQHPLSSFQEEEQEETPAPRTRRTRRSRSATSPEPTGNSAEAEEEPAKV